LKLFGITKGAIAIRVGFVNDVGVVSLCLPQSNGQPVISSTILAPIQLTLRSRRSRKIWVRRVISLASKCATCSTLYWRSSPVADSEESKSMMSSFIKLLISIEVKDPNIDPYTNPDPDFNTDPNLEPYTNPHSEPVKDPNIDPYTNPESE
jgi:hypothetical protein